MIRDNKIIEGELITDNIDRDKKNYREVESESQNSLNNLSPLKFLINIFKSKKNNPKEERKIREKLTEKQTDKMIEDSFPASDPPSTY